MPEMSSSSRRPEHTSAFGRLVPRPVLSLLLAGSWLLLMQSIAGPDIFWAVSIGLVVPWLLGDLLPPRSRVRALPALRLLLRVLWDIVVANLVVARLVLGPASRLRPAWVRVPLATDHYRAVALLATIITTTPGTVSCVIDESRREILVHALDCADADAMASDIKERYEVLLMDIFGLGSGPGGRP